MEVGWDGGVLEVLAEQICKCVGGWGEERMCAHAHMRKDGLGYV